MSRNKAFMTFFAVMLSLGIGLAEERPSTSFVSLDFPGAVSTSASGINAEGDVVGGYTDKAGTTHGFLLRGGRWTSIDYPGAISTGLRGINRQGDMVGTHVDTPGLPGGGVHGFLLQNGDFTDVNYPGHMNTIPVRITEDGQIVGCYHDTDTMGTMHGFVFNNGEYTALDGSYQNIDVPASMNNGVTSDAGALAGLYTDMMTGTTHGYVVTGGVFAPFDFPFSRLTAAWDMNRFGDIVGVYTDTSKNGHGFLLTSGDSDSDSDASLQSGLKGPFNFVSVDYPGAATTSAFGINSRGDVVGSYVDSAKTTHAFLLRRARRRLDD